MGIGKVVSSAEYWMGKQFQIAKFWSPILVFQIEKILEIY